jgi:hypothetical protein
MAKKPAPLVVLHVKPDSERNRARLASAFFLSFVFNGVIIAVFFVLNGFWAVARPIDTPMGPEPEYFVPIDDDKPPPQFDETPLGNPELGKKAVDTRNIGEDVLPGLDIIGPAGVEGPINNRPLSLPPPPGVSRDGGTASITPQPPTLTNCLASGDNFVGRKSAETRWQLANKDGGNFQSEAAVAKGLQFLAKHQAPDGRWSFSAFHQHGRCNCTGQANFDDIAATSFGLLPFLGAGYTHKSAGQYTKQVDAGLKFLVLRQNRDGEFHPNMYSHGLATMAVCEAYALTSDPALRGPAQRALNYIVDAQSEEGGWRYAKKQPGYDTSVGGWQLMALKSGQMAGLRVPTETMNRAKKWLDAAGTPDGAAYGYTTRGEGANTTAVGLLCREYYGWGPRNPGLQAGMKRLLVWKPDPRNMYFSYYATQVMHHAGGDNWEKWNESMRDGLINTQDQGNDPIHAHQKGSWHHPGSYAGRLMDTSLSILTLEVYYRHLPLYRRDIGSDKAILEP